MRRYISNKGRQTFCLFRMSISFICFLKAVISSFLCFCNCLFSEVRRSTLALSDLLVSYNHNMQRTLTQCVLPQIMKIRYVLYTYAFFTNQFLATKILLHTKITSYTIYIATPTIQYIATPTSERACAAVNSTLYFSTSSSAFHRLSMFFFFFIFFFFFLLKKRNSLTIAPMNLKFCM